MDAKLIELKTKHRVNGYLVAVTDVVDDLNLKLPWGYRAAWEWSTHAYDESEINPPGGSNVAEAVLVGCVRVVHGDPHYPVFIYREKTPTQWGISKIAHILGISERRVRALASRRNVGTKTQFGWLFTADDVELLRPGRPGRPRTAISPPAGR